MTDDPQPATAPAAPTTPAPPPPHRPGFRSGIVAVVGRANVGKSSLVNRLLGEKLSIVSPVAQTTRNVIRGILTTDAGQLVLLDTPGVHKAERDLNRQMNRIARASVGGVDAVLLVLDGSEEPRLEDDGWMRRLARANVPAFFALNKQDLVSSCQQAYRDLWTRIAAELASPLVPRWASVSAITGRRVSELGSELLSALPEGPLLFPEEMLTDFPRKLIVADAIREKFFRRLHGDLPHSVAVWIEDIREERNGNWLAFGKVYVRRPSQKAIVIGRHGKVLHAALDEATRELCGIYERKVTLDITVTVAKDWDRSLWFLRRLGYA